MFCNITSGKSAIGHDFSPHEIRHLWALFEMHMKQVYVSIDRLVKMSPEAPRSLALHFPAFPWKRWLRDDALSVWGDCETWPPQTKGIHSAWRVRTQVVLWCMKIIRLLRWLHVSEMLNDQKSLSYPKWYAVSMQRAEGTEALKKPNWRTECGRVWLSRSPSSTISLWFRTNKSLIFPSAWLTFRRVSSWPQTLDRPFLRALTLKNLHL